MSWHNDFDPDCESGHEPTAMFDDVPVQHGQSRTYVSPTCGREVHASNVPGESGPSTRELRTGTLSADAPANHVRSRGHGG
ncbi:hypothetical protein [Natronorubrum tibetense]|uniref:Uncharacterized protein n=1 Tax=Natronorubrum tibetense GA33 TaxID=1114856 RepID=L9VEF1_9EURY|nr:hypothetical protein [Natronorubrum tibetense]ELY35565.1 hypothetical protein C496_23351 [Natronorubrum tibetense GA33]